MLVNFASASDGWEYTVSEKECWRDCTYLHAAELQDAGRREVEGNRKRPKLACCADELMQLTVFICKLSKLQSQNSSIYFSILEHINIH